MQQIEEINCDQVCYGTLKLQYVAPLSSCHDCGYQQNKLWLQRGVRVMECFKESSEGKVQIMVVSILHGWKSYFHWLKLDLASAFESSFQDGHSKGQKCVKLGMPVHSPEVCVNVCWCSELFPGLPVVSVNPFFHCCSGNCMPHSVLKMDEVSVLGGQWNSYWPPFGQGNV